MKVHVLSALARLTGQLVARLVKAALLLAILAGLPYGLVTQIGSPLPRTLPTVDDLLHTLTAPVTDTLVLNVLAVAAWILWAAFIVCVAVEVAAAIRGVPAPRLGLVAPLQALTGWLVAGLAAGALAAAPVASAIVPAAPTASAVSAHHGAQQATALAVRAEQAGTDLPRHTVSASSVHTGYVTVLVGNERFTHTVVKGDNLSHIARDWLGDPDRWPEVYHLNKGRHFPKVGGTLHDPDLIYPGWVLYLPEGARPPAGTAPATPPTLASPAPAAPPPSASATPPGSPSGAPSQRPSPSASVATSAPADPDGVVTEPSASPSASTNGPASPDTASPSSDPRAEDDNPGPGAGASLPGGWVSIPLAAALLAATAMVWKRRRHRYIPKTLDASTLDDADLRPPPPVVARLRRAVRQQAPNLLQPLQPAQPTVAEYASGDPDELQLPPVGPSGLDLAGLNNQIPASGLGLIGPGAEPAARALLVATLSSGSPADPDARGQVVIPADALTTLLGAQAVEVGPIPRLAVTATLSEALRRVEELLIERRRLLEDYEASDLAGMRAADPYHPPMPPVLLLAEVPPPDLRARLSTTLHLGTPLQISAVLLGEWPRGDTLTVRTDGHTTGGDYQRLGVLDVPTTLQLLEVLREAHTGEPTGTAPVEASPVTSALATTPTSTDPEQPRETAAEPAATTADPAAADVAITPAELPDGSSTGPSDEPPSPTAAGGGQNAGEASPRRRRRQPVRIQLVGTPTIFDRDGNPVTGLRHHARQLLVYLAVHRNGADLPQIMEAFWPTATLRRAGERLSTEVGDLRGRIRQAAGDDKVQPVVNTGGRYHLNPELLDIDLWTLSDALRRAGAATEPAHRIAALREAVDTHTGPLADGYDYDWIEQPREQIRRHGVRARLHLADLLAGTDPRQAADLTKAATNLDPYNEDLARQAIRAFARIGDPAAIRTQLQRLRDALDEIDEEPSGETIALAAQLQRQVAGTSGRSKQEQQADEVRGTPTDNLDNP